MPNGREKKQENAYWKISNINSSKIQMQYKIICLYRLSLLLYEHCTVRTSSKFSWHFTFNDVVYMFFMT